MEGARVLYIQFKLRYGGALMGVLGRIIDESSVGENEGLQVQCHAIPYPKYLIILSGSIVLRHVM